MTYTQMIFEIHEIENQTENIYVFPFQYTEPTKKSISQNIV